MVHKILLFISDLIVKKIQIVNLQLTISIGQIVMFISLRLKSMTIIILYHSLIF